MHLDFPDHAYVPGQTARHPDGLFSALVHSVRPEMSVAQIRASDAWQGGWVLFDHGFFWEAHEVWEPVWMCLPRHSDERTMVQACIQLANAHLKKIMGRPNAVLRLCEMVERQIEGLNSSAPVFGVDVSELKRRIQCLQEHPN